MDVEVNDFITYKRKFDYGKSQGYVTKVDNYGNVFVTNTDLSIASVCKITDILEINKRPIKVSWYGGNSMKRKPIIITFDSLDGSGKQSQTELLINNLESMGCKVGTADFPQYKKWHSFLVRLYLKGKFGKDPNKVNPYIASLFYAFDRFFAYHFHIKKAYKDMDYIIFDRWVTANMIFQTTKAKDDIHVDKMLKYIESLEYGLLRLPRPDVVVVLDISVEQTLKNLKSRDKLDIHENFDMQLRARRVLHYLIKKYNWVRIECMSNQYLMKTKEDIHNSIMDTIIYDNR